jgi:hypothetical protein
MRLAHATRATKRMGKETAKEGFTTEEAVCIRESGRITKCMALAFLRMRMAQLRTRANGKMMSSMVRELSTTKIPFALMGYSIIKILVPPQEYG